MAGCRDVPDAADGLSGGEDPGARAERPQLTAVDRPRHRHDGAPDLRHVVESRGRRADRDVDRLVQRGDGERPLDHALVRARFEEHEGAVGLARTVRAVLAAGVLSDILRDAAATVRREAGGARPSTSRCGRHPHRRQKSATQRIEVIAHPFEEPRRLPSALPEQRPITLDYMVARKRDPVPSPGACRTSRRRSWGDCRELRAIKAAAKRGPLIAAAAAEGSARRPSRRRP